MATQIYVEVRSGVPGGALLIREHLKDLCPGVVWRYDDADQVLEMEGYQEWNDVEAHLQQLDAHYPFFRLSWVKTEKGV